MLFQQKFRISPIKLNLQNMSEFTVTDVNTATASYTIANVQVHLEKVLWPCIAGMASSWAISHSYLAL